MALVLSAFWTAASSWFGLRGQSLGVRASVSPAVSAGMVSIRPRLGVRIDGICLSVCLQLEYVFVSLCGVRRRRHSPACLFLARMSVVLFEAMSGREDTG